MILNNLTLFLRIVEKGGMAAAGRELGFSPATVSERLATLEAYYGARLLTRTTRSISLTEEGQMLVDGAKRLLEEAEEIESRIKLGVEKISGMIRISAPVDLGRNRIAPLLTEFMKQNPDVHIDFHLSDQYVDLTAQGIDLAVRFGELADSMLRSKKIASNLRVVCAAPSYLEKNGAPEHPNDLRHHRAVLMRFGENIDNAWHFKVKDKETKILMRATCVANDGELVREWCRAGQGLALKSKWDISDDLEAGDLVQILRPYAMPLNAIQIVYPPGRIQPRRTRALIEFLASKFSELSKRSC